MFLSFPFVYSIDKRANNEIMKGLRVLYIIPNIFIHHLDQIGVNIEDISDFELWGLNGFHYGYLNHCLINFADSPRDAVLCFHLFKAFGFLYYLSLSIHFDFVRN